MKKHHFYIIFFLLLHVIGEAHPQGLQFYGNEKRISERSSFCVYTDEYIPRSIGKFSISFEYAAQNIESPGYIFYLKNSEGEDAFNLTYVYENSEGHFMFAQDGKQIYYTARHPASRLHGKWMPISLEMDVTNNRAEICIGENKAAIEDIGLDNKYTFSPRLFFGMCNHILETASFSIRNLTVSSNGETCHFPLNESKGEEVHDSKGRIVGHVTNPIWLINHSYYWTPRFRSYSSTPSGFVFAPGKQEFHIYNQDTLITYDILRNLSRQFPYSSRSGAFPIRLGMNFYDEAQGSIYAYELNWDKTFVAQMNPEDKTWKTISRGEINLQMHHHCGVFDPQRQQFLFFGGYGNRKYYNAFIRYSLQQNRWDTVAFSGDAIPPRFFAGMAMTPDCKHAYIYGGKGNEAGDQNVGIQYYYDLYRLDLERKQIKKLWEHKAPQVNRIPTRDMILSEDGQYLYLLAYPEYKPQTQLQLYRLSISDGSYEMLGDSIPLTSEEIATNANLYFNPELEEFYCVIQEFEKYGQSVTRIYSLANPPVSLAAVKLYDEPTTDTRERPLWLYIVILALILVFGSILAVVKRKESSKTKALSDAPPREDAMPAVEIVPDQAPPAAEEPETAEKEEQLIEDPMVIRKNCIFLFGTFRVTDKNGRDVTYMFSPKIRHLFLYILLNSITKDGVLSSDLNNLFWPDKPDDKIKNLKNVTMNHLRKTLQELEGIRLTHQKGYFRLALTEECYCDYQRAYILTDGMKHAPLTESGSTELYHILAHGKFLSTIESSLFDYPKQQAETFTVSLLSEQIHTFYRNGRNSATLRTCNILFAIDPLSDTALAYAVCTYRRQNRSDKAIQLYSSFTKEYRRVMDEDYPIAFDDIDTSHIRL